MSQAHLRKRVQFFIAGAVMLAGFALLYWSGCKESADDHAQRLSTEHQLRIAFGDPATFYVPPYGPADAQLPSVEITRADDAVAAVALEGIEQALRQYPANFVAKLVRAIFVGMEVRVDGVEAGGTVGPAWVVLAAPARLGREAIYATSYIGVHHELSSFVLRRKPETAQLWAQFTPAGWLYQHETKAIIGLASAADPSPATGFLSAYGSSDPENDFNVYAEKMFTEPQVVAKLAREHALVRKKLSFVMESYVAIDSRMIEVFRGLGLD